MLVQVEEVKEEEVAELACACDFCLQKKRLTNAAVPRPSLGSEG